ncbi:MAG: radical SAM protein [Verrucomicrobiota bacterium]|nr:radical SAM protein [Verrucomicrobiota bacterium]
MLFINPDYKLWFKYPPMGILYLIAVLREKKIKSDFIDAYLTKNIEFAIDNKIQDYDTVGITATVGQAYSAKKIAEYIREKYPEVRIVWGGPHSTAEYETLLPKLADIVVLGEGEKQTASICSNTPLNEIPGIAYFKKNKIIHNPRENYIQDLDSIPFPAWDLIDSKQYHSPGRRPLYLMVTERGCPFHCINCFKDIHGNTFRTRSVENVINEITLLKEKYNAREIHFWDDNFTLNPKRAKKICSEIINKKLNEDLRFALPSGIRADIYDEEMFTLMHKAGFYFLNVGIESADQEVLNKLKKDLDISKVKKTVETLCAMKFRVGLLFMMGLPFDTKESLNKTIDFAVSLPAHHAFISIVTPLSGTPLFEMVKNKMKRKTHYEDSFIGYDIEEERFVNENLPYEILLQSHHKAYRRFYANPKRIYRIIKTILKEGFTFNDFLFMLKCGFKILSTGHR